jgi:hypothetical protein
MMLPTVNRVDGDVAISIVPAVKVPSEADVSVKIASENAMAQPVPRPAPRVC